MKTYVIPAGIVAVFALFLDLSVSQIASADLPEPRVYKVPLDRSNKVNHFDAMFIVHAKKWEGETTYWLDFIQMRGKWQGRPFVCPNALPDTSGGTLKCTEYTEYGGFKIKETVTIGTLAGPFCGKLRKELSDEGYPDAVMEDGDCGRRKKCSCYKVMHLCLDESDGEYKDICPDFDKEDADDADDPAVLVPPGRGAGSGSTN